MQGYDQRPNPHNNNGANPSDQNPQHPNKLGRTAPLQTNHPCKLCNVYGHYTHECLHMDHIKQFLQNKSQRDTNAATQAQPNPTPLGPPPMVIQKLLPLQGLVATTPFPPHAPTTPAVAPPTETGVHHLLAMTTEEVKM